MTFMTLRAPAQRFCTIKTEKVREKRFESVWKERTHDPDDDSEE